MADRLDPGPYCDHLRMEINFAGWLSFFSLALAALAADRIILARQIAGTDELWALVCGGIGLLTLAAFCFYCQRNTLARLHGRFSLLMARGEDGELNALLSEATLWSVRLAAWWGFVALGFGLVSLGAACLCLVYHQRASYWSWPIFTTLAFVVVLMGLLSAMARDPQYQFPDAPLRKVLSMILKRSMELVNEVRMH